MAYVDWNNKTNKYEIRRWNGFTYEYLPVFDEYDDAVKYCNDAGIRFPVRIENDGLTIDIINTDDENSNPFGNNAVECFFFYDFDSEEEVWYYIKEYLSRMNFKEENVTVECGTPFPLF